MYKILMVDDEVDVRENIARTIDWENAGFILCGCAAGALEAMKMADELLPDVVLTDIHMPYMDGLEMIERLKEVYPAMQFVVVSGYDDFAYAQRALKSQAMDYLLKPLSAESMLEALKKIKERLDTEITRRRSVEILQEEARKNRALLDRMALLELLFESTNEATELLAGDDQAAGALFPAYMTVLIPEKTHQNETVLVQDFKGRQDLMVYSIREVCEETLNKNGTGQCVCHRGRFVLLAQVNEREALEMAANVQDRIRMYLGLSTKAVVSECVRAGAQLPEMYQRALLLLAHEEPHAASNALFLMENTAPDAGIDDITANLQPEVAALLRQGEQELIDDYFRALAQKLAQARVSAAFLQLLVSLTQTVVSTTAARAGITAEDICAMIDESRITYPLDIMTALDALRGLTSRVSRLISAQNRFNSRAFARELEKYIQQHYANPTLSVADVCEAFRISQTQLSLVFRRELGVSFLQYVLELRIRSAQNMLRQSDKKIYQIALENGFEDPGYFSYCFKQRCGVTPKAYRQGAKENAQDQP